MKSQTLWVTKHVINLKKMYFMNIFSKIIVKGIYKMNLFCVALFFLSVLFEVENKSSKHAIAVSCSNLGGFYHKCIPEWGQTHMRTQNKEKPPARQSRWKGGGWVSNICFST